jgi:hypothetical protein
VPLDGWGVVVGVGEVLSPTVIDYIDLLMGGAGGVVVLSVSEFMFLLPPPGPISLLAVSGTHGRAGSYPKTKKRNDIPRHFC